MRLEPAVLPGCSGHPAQVLTEAEYGEHCRIDSPLFFRGEMARQVTNPLHVDCADLLNEHPGSGAVDVDFGPEGRGLGVRRRRRYEYHRAGEEGVGLHDDSESGSVLFVADSLGKPEGEDVTPAHEGSP